jgi:hypothetical protein
MTINWEYGRLENGQIIKLEDLSFEFVKSLDCRKIIENSFKEEKEDPK